MKMVPIEELAAECQKKARKLVSEALESCKARGHRMKPFSYDEAGFRASSTCWYCEKWVVVNANPLPNEIEIGGTAVAESCWSPAKGCREEER